MTRGTKRERQSTGGHNIESSSASQKVTCVIPGIAKVPLGLQGCPLHECLNVPALTNIQIIRVYCLQYIYIFFIKDYYVADYFENCQSLSLKNTNAHIGHLIINHLIFMIKAQVIYVFWLT